jgi:hypothetical protein
VTECRHDERRDGICIACGDCLHELVLNGACFYCGSSDLDPIAMSPKPVAALIAADKLVRKKP